MLKEGYSPFESCAIKRRMNKNVFGSFAVLILTSSLSSWAYEQSVHLGPTRLVSPSADARENSGHQYRSYAVTCPSGYVARSMALESEVATTVTYPAVNAVIVLCEKIEINWTNVPEQVQVSGGVRRSQDDIHFWPTTECSPNYSNDINVPHGNYMTGFFAYFDHYLKNMTLRCGLTHYDWVRKTFSTESSYHSSVMGAIKVENNDSRLKLECSGKELMVGVYTRFRISSGGNQTWLTQVAPYCAEIIPSVQ